jgi:competence protein ComEC
MTLVQVGAIAVVVADGLALHELAQWLGSGVHWASHALVESARLVDVAPWLTWRVPSPLPAVVASYYACLCVGLVEWRRRGRPRGWMTATAMLLFGWIVIAPAARVRAWGDGRLAISMFDVGQGDSMLITFPNGRTLLVDAGGVPAGSFDIGDRVVGPALRGRQLLALDYLAVTHGDADHVGGARTIIRDFAPREVWWGIPVAGHAPTSRVRQQAEHHRAGWRTLQSGDRLNVGGTDVYVHHPPPADWERQRVRNNDSLVIELRFARVAVLLMGDIDRTVEDLLLPSLGLPPIVILKVAHHGSITSTAERFLRATRPSAALIGVGRSNSYGHPSPYVLGRLHDVGAEVFRTDLDGQIDLVTDGNEVWLSTFTGRQYRISAVPD